MTLSSAFEALPAWLGVGAGGGMGFFFAKWFVEWLGGRVDKREAAVEAGAVRLDKSVQDLIARLEKRVCQLEDRSDRLEKELADCRRKHSESEAEVMRMKAQMQGLGDARQTAQVIVATDRILDRKEASK